MNNPNIFKKAFDGINTVDVVTAFEQKSDSFALAGNRLGGTFEIVATPASTTSAKTSVSLYFIAPGNGNHQEQEEAFESVSDQILISLGQYKGP